MTYTSTIMSPDGATAALYAPWAGMVCCSLRHGDAELVDPRDGLGAYAQRGATMGVPLLYPWANRLADFQYRAAGRTVTLPGGGARIPLDPGGLPIHGLVPSLMAWSLLPGGEDPSRIKARLDWNEPALLELFPFEHEVMMEAVVANGLVAEPEAQDAAEAEAATYTVTTTVRATGQSPVPVSFGFHPYLCLPASRRDGCRLELPPTRRLVLDARSIPTGEREPPEPRRGLELADTSWDDGFELLAQPARFAAHGSGRGVAVELLEGFPYAQIYAPPEQDFICFEPMTAPANALCSGDGLAMVSPGEEYRAAFRISAWGP